MSWWGRKALHRECGDLASGLDWDNLSDVAKGPGLEPDGLLAFAKNKFPLDSGALWEFVTLLWPYWHLPISSDRFDLSP